MNLSTITALVACSLVAALGAAPASAQQPDGDWNLYQAHGRADPRWEGHVKKGLALFASGQIDRAEAQLEKAVGAGCGDGVVLFRLAACKYLKGALTEARVLLAKAEAAI